MKLPSFTRKPRWQSKDAAIRREAVELDDGADLAANLSRLAREDEDARVRIAAMKRLADPGIAQGIALGDSDTEVRRHARALWLELLAGTHTASPTLDVRLRLLKGQDDNELVEHLVRRGREPALRRAALERVARPALIVERALEDTDQEIRAAAVDRIDDEKALQRIADAARRSDKQVQRRARARIDALRLDRGDDAARLERARSLCERLERLVRFPGSDVEDNIVAQWAALGIDLPEPLRERFASAGRHLAASRLGPRRASESAAAADRDTDAHARPIDASTSPDALAPGDTVESVASPVDDGANAPTYHGPTTTSDADADPVDAADAVAAAMLAKARFKASIDDAEAARKIEHDRQRGLEDGFERAIGMLDAAIDSGRSVDAHPARRTLDDLRKQMSVPLRRELAARATAAEGRYAEFSRWQHWADNQRRAQLCESVEQVAVAALHPDAVATRVREAQAEWSRLDVAEGRAGNAHGSLSRRFHTACRGALAPAQDYFRKRRDLRESHATDIEARLGQASKLVEATPVALVAARRELVDTLRSLDTIDPHQRKSFADRIKAQLDTFDARIGAHDGAVANGKSILIESAQTLANAPASDGSATQARALQKRWQALGNGKRNVDQAQWKQFREAIDGVFARLDSERAERDSREQASYQQALSLCTDSETLAASDAAGDTGALRQLQLTWKALDVRDPTLRARFDAACKLVRATAAQRQRTLRQARFAGWLERYAICRAAEQARAVDDDMRTLWTATVPTDIAAATLQYRFDHAADTDELNDGEPNRRDAVVALELLAAVASPAEDAERRRRLQLERLSARMGGGPAPAPADELAQWMLRWSELGRAVDLSLDARIEAAVRERLAALP